MTVGTHPEELRGFKVHMYDKVERHFELHSRARSSSVWVLTSKIFLGPKNMDFDLFKTVSGIVSRHLITFLENETHPLQIEFSYPHRKMY